ncbi:MAG TPA: helix-hairpin-helix domain-containing protein [Thermoanaerobaculia bacterium]|nr:helix-hairpin-helix domain-containing protein [Thermoanaerobaculia bacterium]
MRSNRIRIGPWLTMLALALLVFEGTAFAAKAKKPLVDLNTATQKELEDLPGVGEATAKKIIAGRPYKSVSDLEKAGVPAKTISKIEKQVTVSGGGSSASTSSMSSSASTASTASKSAPAKTEKAEKTEKAAPAAAMGAKVDLNTASQKELEDLPGVGPATAKKIIAGRPYSSVSDLSRAGVNKSTMDKIGGMVTVSGKAAVAEAAPPAKPAASAPAAPATDTSKSTSSSSSSSKMTASSTSSKTAESAAGTPQQPPVKGMVWVNTETKVFHREGDHWYGNTKHGKFMTEADAIKAGYRESKQKTSAK